MTTGEPGRITRWHWDKLSKATNREEVEAVLAEVAQNMGEGDIELKISVTPKQYVRIMQLTWFAFRIREVTQVTPGLFVDRALQVYEQYLGRLQTSLRARR